jgi:hypothetical protein
MKTALSAPTPAESLRLDRIKREVGCIACRQHDRPGIPADAHHILSGGRRISHSHTIPLCPWHHRGHPLPHRTAATTAAILGPSIAHEPNRFRETYGPELCLLAETDRLLAALEGAVA